MFAETIVKYSIKSFSSTLEELHSGVIKFTFKHKNPEKSLELCEYLRKSFYVKKILDTYILKTNSTHKTGLFLKLNEFIKGD